MPYRRRELRAAFQPPDPRDASELRLLDVLLDVIGNSNDGEGRFTSAQLREEAREAGRLSATARLAPDAPSEVLELLGSQDGGLDRLLSQAGLTSREADVITMAASGAPTREIQALLSRGRRSRNGAPAVAVRTVEHDLYLARVKLRRLLEAPAEALGSFDETMRPPSGKGSADDLMEFPIGLTSPRFRVDSGYGR